MPDRKQLPSIAEAQRTPLVEQLLEQIEELLEENRRQAERIQQLRDEIAILKGQKAKPKFKPSGMDRETERGGEVDGCDERDSGNDEGGKRQSRKRPGSAKRSKTQHLRIHETLEVAPTVAVPEGSRFKGYRDFVVQDLRIEPHNIRYRLEIWQTPDGERLLGALPASLEGGHFGPELRRYVLYQHHHCHVTQPLLHEQLRAWGIDISVGQIDALLSSANDAFLAEKDQLLIAGLEVSRYITVDDSGARHQGNNGYVTQIGNDWFAWFASTASKSRINFLQLLHAGNITYTLNAHALSYLQEERLPKEPLRRLQRQTSATIAGVACWEAHLDALGIEREHHRRIATEGALLGGLIEKGFVRLMDTEDAVTDPINVGNPSEFNMREFAENVLHLTGSRSNLEHRALPQDDPKQRLPDIALARQHLDWEPKIPLDQGLSLTIGYFEKLLSRGLL